MNSTTPILMFVFSLFLFGHSAPAIKERSVTCKPECNIPKGLSVLSRVTYDFIGKFDANNTNAANTVDAIASFIRVHNQTSKEADASTALVHVAKLLEDHFCLKMNETIEQEFLCSPVEWMKFKLLQGVREEFEKLLKDKFTEKFDRRCSDSDCGYRCDWLESKSIPYKFKCDVFASVSCKCNATLAQ